MKSKKRLLVVILTVVLLLVLTPKKLSWLVPGSDADITGYVMYEMFSGSSGAHHLTTEGVEQLRALLNDTWVLWWGTSNTIPMKDKDDNPFQLELYTDQLVPATIFNFASDGLIYMGRMRFFPLNHDLRETLGYLKLQG